MKASDFCYWLQGFFEIQHAGDMSCALTVEQSKVIQAHLALVFKHELDPAIDGGDPAKAAELQKVHDGPRPPFGGGGPGGIVYRC